MSTAPIAIVQGTGAAAATWTTASYTPAANAWELAFISSYKASASPALPTAVYGAGGAWTYLCDAQTTTVANPNIRSAWYVSPTTTGATPAARTLQVDATGAAAISVGIETVLAVDTNGTIVQSASGEDLANGDPPFAFGSAPGATNVTMVGASFGGSNATTPPTGYTNLFSVTSSTARRSSVAYDITSAAQSGSYTSTNIRSLCLAIELAPAGAGSQTITGALFTDGDTFYGSTVAPGAVTITGALFSDANSFFGATVSASYTITGTLFSDADTFHGSAISTSYSIAGGLFTDTDTFFGATISDGSAPSGPPGNDNWLVRARRRGIK